MAKADKKLYGVNLFGEALSPKGTIMNKKFFMPPFSVLDARSGQWSARKRAWLQLGLKGEEGRARDESDTMNRAYRKTLDGHGARLREQYNKRKVKQETGADIDEGLSYDPDGPGTGTSIFDPVLTELAYRWFCPPGGCVLDPFAGGSTRGIVAALSDFMYVGIEVREVQVKANKEQAANILSENYPKWLLGDSTNAGTVLDDNGYYPGHFDLLFTCPPYYDLELYSHDDRDGSTHSTYEKFLDWYFQVFEECELFLAPNRFAVVVVGEIRDPKTGAYRNFVADTINVFISLGYTYYNELILVTKTGSLPLRAGKYFTTSRKVGKSHQNVLVFWKGDTKNIREVFKDAEV